MAQWPWRTRVGQGVLALGLLGLWACSPQMPKVRLAPITGGVEEPTIFFEGFRMVSTRQRTLEWEFVARAAQIYEKQNMAKAQDIRIVYWRNGRAVSTLTAIRGFVNTESNDIHAEQKVVMVSEEGVRLYTERLNWDQKQGRIYTDLPVQVIRKNSILTGIGLEADKELKHVDVLANVKIKLRSFKEFESNTGNTNTKVR